MADSGLPKAFEPVRSLHETIQCINATATNVEYWAQTIRSQFAARREDKRVVISPNMVVCKKNLASAYSELKLLEDMLKEYEAHGV